MGGPVRGVSNVTFLIFIRMFLNKCPLTTIISMNVYFDPHYHMRVGAAIRSLREQRYLVIGTGGAVHNLYWNHWVLMVEHRDNFAYVVPLKTPLREFRQSIEDVVTSNRGPALRRDVTRLMKHPRYRDAYGTDDDFMA